MSDKKHYTIGVDMRGSIVGNEILYWNPTMTIGLNFTTADFKKFINFIKQISSFPLIEIGKINKIKPMKKLLFLLPLLAIIGCSDADNPYDARINNRGCDFTPMA